MDAFQAIIKVPSWAYDFCFYYMAAAAVVVVYSLYMITQLLMLSDAAKKGVPVIGLIVVLLLSGTVSTVLTLMQFWICRSALRRPEAFAVKCASAADCVVAGGPPQGADCTCGERGVCGGCQSSDLFGSEPEGVLS